MQRSIRKPRRAAARFVLFICLIYLLGLAIASAALWTYADQWWLATALSFAPLWMMAAPLIVLFPLAILWHRWSLITLAFAAGILVFPIMGMQIGWHGAADEDHATSLRVMTCNVHRAQLNAAEFRAVLDGLRPDVVAMQDWTSVDQQVFPSSAWNIRRDGELFLASRFPIVGAQSIALAEPEAVNFNVRRGAAVWYRLLTPSGEVSLINVHLSSPHPALEALVNLQPTSPEQLAYNTRCREMESASLDRFREALSDPVLVMGDFNTPTVSTLYHRHWDDLTNAFSAVGFGFGTTHISTASSVRIDHILYGAGWQARACWTGPAVGSPHRPLVADLLRSGDLPSIDAHADVHP